jgi:hypothetical protein
MRRLRTVHCGIIVVVGSLGITIPVVFMSMSYLVTLRKISFIECTETLGNKKFAGNMSSFYWHRAEEDPETT